MFFNLKFCFEGGGSDDFKSFDGPSSTTSLDSSLDSSSGMSSGLGLQVGDNLLALAIALARTATRARVATEAKPRPRLDEDAEDEDEGIEDEPSYRELKWIWRVYEVAMM